MQPQKLYTLLAAVLGVLLLYGLYNIVMSFVYGYQLEWRFILYFLPIATGITGLVIFIISQFKKSSLLRLFMCYELLSFPFTILFYIGFFKKSLSPFSTYQPIIDWQFYLGIFIDAAYVITCSIGLWYLSKKRVPAIQYFDSGINRTGQFEPANGGIRFANRVVDGFMIFFVLFKGMSRLYFWFDKEVMPDSFAMVYVFEIPMLIVYYLLLEGIFNTTAGKCVTNTTIVNETGGRPSFAKILGRTFCRLIPFEAFTFFKAGARGWHDSIPNTWVIQTVDISEATDNEIVLDAASNAM